MPATCQSGPLHLALVLALYVHGGDAIQASANLTTHLIQTDVHTEAIAEDRLMRAYEVSDGCYPVSDNLKPKLKWTTTSKEGVKMNIDLTKNEFEICDGEGRMRPVFESGLLTPSTSGGITMAFFCSLAAVLIVAAIGMLWDHRLKRGAEGAFEGTAQEVLRGRDTYDNGNQHVTRSIAVFIVACYALLVPGLIYPVISLPLYLHVDVPATMRALLPPELPPMTSVRLPIFPTPVGGLVESMFSMMRDLFLFGIPAAGLLVFFYGIIIPVIKLIIYITIVVIVEVVKVNEGTYRLNRWLKRFMWIVRFISKWDAPKLNAYVAMKIMFDGLNTQPHMTSDTALDVGFAFYSIFSIGTLLAGVIHHDFNPSGTAPRRLTLSAEQQPWSKEGLALVVCFAVAVFLTLFIIGATVPLMSMEVAPIVWNAQMKAAGLAGFESAFTQQSLFGCIAQSFGKLSLTDINPVIIVVLVLVFNVSFPILSMAAYIVAAFSRFFPSARAHRVLQSSLWWSDLLEYLAMLDTLLLGTLATVVTCGGAFANDGVTMDLNAGWVWLLAAQIWMWGCQWFLHREGTF